MREPLRGHKRKRPGRHILPFDRGLPPLSSCVTLPHRLRAKSPVLAPSSRFSPGPEPLDPLCALEVTL